MCEILGLPLYTDITHTLPEKAQIQPELGNQNGWKWLAEGDSGLFTSSTCYKTLGIGPAWIWQHIFGLLGLPLSMDTTHASPG